MLARALLSIALAPTLGAAEIAYVAGVTTNSIGRFDLTTGEFLGTLLEVDAPYDLAITPFGTLLVVSEARYLYEYDLTSGSFLRTIGSAGSGYRVQYTPLNTVLFAGTEYDYSTGTAIRGNLPNGSAAFRTATEFWIATGEDLYVYSYPAFDLIRTISGEGSNLHFAADGRALLINVGIPGVLSIDPVTGQNFVLVRNGPTFPAGLAVRANGNLLVTSLDYTTIFEYDGTTGAFQRFIVGSPLVQSAVSIATDAVDFCDIPIAGDINGDGVVDLSDLGILLSNYGMHCP